MQEKIDDKTVPLEFVVRDFSHIKNYFIKFI